MCQLDPVLHVVRAGESLATLAERYGCSPAAFVMANPHRALRGPPEVVAGEALWLPTSGRGLARVRDRQRRLLDGTMGQLSTPPGGLDGVTVSGGEVNADGLVNNLSSALQSKAPSALTDIANAAVQTVAAYSSTVIGVTEAAGYLTTDATVSAAVAAAAPVAGAVFAVTALLLAIDPASGGPGCCGTDTSQRYGTCDPAQFAWNGPNGPGAADAGGSTQWDGHNWVNGPPPPDFTPSNPWELWIASFMFAAFANTNDCWHFATPQWYVAQFAHAVAGWNLAHSPSSTTELTRMVNVIVPYQFGSGSGFNVQQPSAWTDPIAVALNFGSMTYGPVADPQLGYPAITGSLAPIDGLASVTINTGPVVSTSGTGATGPTPAPAPAPASSSSSSSTGTAVVVGVGLLGAVLALGWWGLGKPASWDALKAAWSRT